MELLNQIGHLQHWGLSPASNVLFRYPLQQTQRSQKLTPLNILLSGCSDIRHLIKTVSDICQLKPERPIHFYLHEIKPQLIARMFLQLHILHEQHLNFDERMQLFLDLYANAMIKQRDAKYLNGVREDLLNLVHEQKKKVKTPLQHFVKFDRLRFEERDQMSEVISSWSTKIPFQMEKLRDTRLRCLFGERYDHRANLVDWDYNMLLQQGAPIIHYYHYRQWRLTGLAFEQRFSTYTQPNRTLSSYAPGRKKQEKTSCLVRGYWGDIVLSPYIAMGIHTDYQQKDLIFKKANEKYIGHSVELTEYHMQYWITMLSKMETYVKIFRDYYRTDQKGRQSLDKSEEQKKKKKSENIKKKKQKENVIEEKDEQYEDEKDEKQQKQEEIVQKLQDQQESDKITLTADSFKPKKLKKRESKTEQLDSEQQRQRLQVQANNAKDITTSNENQYSVLPGFKAVQLEVHPMLMNIDNLTKPKYSEFFDVVVLGFIHSAFIKKGIRQVVKKNGQLHCQKPTFLLPKKKEQRKQLTESMAKLMKEEGFSIQYENKFFFIGEKNAQNAMSQTSKSTKQSENMQQKIIQKQ